MTYTCKRCPARVYVNAEQSASTEDKSRADARRSGWRLGRDRETGLCPAHNKFKSSSYERLHGRSQ